MTDRTGCAAEQHGTSNAYMNWRCRCDDAKNAQRVYIKKRKLARLRGQRGHTDMVPTWRVRRRFEALGRLGYSSREVQKAAWGYELGSGTGSYASRANMTAGRFAKLDAVYQQWSAVPGPNDRARKYAERMNHSAPFDWDNIDDPDEVPFNMRPEALEERRIQKERERNHRKARARWAKKKAARQVAA